MNASAIPFDGFNKYIRITDIDEHTHKYKEDNIVSPGGDLNKKYLVRKNDILFARTGSVGRTYWHNGRENNIYFAGYLIRMNISSDYSSPFIFYNTQSQKYRLWVRENSARSIQPGLNAEQYKSYRFKIPSLAEQSKISAFLSLIDKRIETQSKIIKEYKSLIMYMINNHSDKAGEFQDLPFSSLHLRASEGGTPNTKEEEYYTPKDIPFIKIEDLKEKYIKESKFHISKKGLQKSSAWLIPENSVIFSNGATIGEVAINIFPIATKQGILGIIPNRKKIETEYLYYIMKSSIFRKRTNMITTRGTISTAYIKDINNIRCKIPNLKEQMKFIKNIDKLEKRLENEKNLFSRFNNLKKYLLNNMFI